MYVSTHYGQTTQLRADQELSLSLVAIRPGKEVVGQGHSGYGYSLETILKDATK